MKLKVTSLKVQDWASICIQFMIGQENTSTEFSSGFLCDKNVVILLFKFGKVYFDFQNETEMMRYCATSIRLTKMRTLGPAKGANG